MLMLIMVTINQFHYLFNQYNDSIYLAALAKFQIEHGLIPDMLIGNKTAEALSLSPYRYYKQIVANLERWRWKNDWGSKYLYVNIIASNLSYKRQEMSCLI